MGKSVSKSKSWPDDRVAMLTKLWAEGLSASQIAQQLGDKTRNAVIGKVHRLGLSGRAKPSKPKRKTTASAKVSKPRVKTTRAPSAPRTPRIIAAAPQAPAPLDAKPMANGEFATILTITDHMCKWPIGDPGTPGFRFCGRKTDPEEPYCVPHSQVAYQPSRRRGSNQKAIGPNPSSRKRIM